MHWKKNWYLVHRWLGLLVGVQLLAWSAGGFTFSILAIENVRGNTDRTSAAEPRLVLSGAGISPREAIERASSNPGFSMSVQEALLRERRGRLVYELFGAKNEPLASVDATSGVVTRRITEAEAEAIALADFAHEATTDSVAFLEGEPPLEYRGGRMPVYRVVLDHAKQTHFYICPVTGEVFKRRNRLWRIFDFFWMLHIMDYGERDDFNHWLLTGMSVLAITTSASGLVLWWWRRPRWLRRGQ